MRKSPESNTSKCQSEDRWPKTRGWRVIQATPAKLQAEVKKSRWERRKRGMDRWEKVRGCPGSKEKAKERGWRESETNGPTAGGGKGREKGGTERKKRKRTQRNGKWAAGGRQRDRKITTEQAHGGDNERREQKTAKHKASGRGRKRQTNQHNCERKAHNQTDSATQPSTQKQTTHTTSEVEPIITEFRT